MQFNVLLIGNDPKQTEVYAALIRDMVECKIDVMSQIENATQWVSRARYHLVVVDMPHPVAMLEKIKRAHPESCVIVISERASIEEAVSMIRLGAEDYLQKPIHIDAFRLAVRRGIDRKALFEDDGVYSRYLNLVNVCQMISASLEEERVFSIVKSYLSRELRSSHSAIYTRNAQGEFRVLEADGQGDTAMDEIFEIAVQSAGLPDSLVESSFYRFFERSKTKPGLFAFRFRCTGETEYWFICLSPRMPDPLNEFESRMKILRAQIEVTGQNILKYRDVQEMAYVDDVTGLHNTRYLNKVVDREIEKARLTKGSFAVLFIDADKFKLVNDQHGHLNGSKLLTELGRKLKNYVRDTDAIVRYGGDEFIAILTPCDLATGKLVAERIRRSIESSIFLQEDGLALKVTVSIGVAIFPDHAGSKEDIIEAADHAMYVAKKESRNCVFIADMDSAKSMKVSRPGEKDV